MTCSCSAPAGWTWRPISPMQAIAIRDPHGALCLEHAVEAAKHWRREPAPEQVPAGQGRFVL